MAPSTLRSGASLPKRGPGRPPNAPNKITADIKAAILGAFTKVGGEDAPVAGLNFRDAIAALGPTDALILDNYFPHASYVELRRRHQTRARIVIPDRTHAHGGSAAEKPGAAPAPADRHGAVTAAATAPTPAT